MQIQEVVETGGTACRVEGANRITLGKALENAFGIGKELLGLGSNQLRERQRGASRLSFVVPGIANDRIGQNSGAG
jgi:hypothetical protein